MATPAATITMTMREADRLKTIQAVVDRIARGRDLGLTQSARPGSPDSQRQSSFFALPPPRRSCRFLRVFAAVDPSSLAHDGPGINYTDISPVGSKIVDF
jgi:hypothetical protein